MEMKKTTKLRNLITSSQLESIMEAHNALSARIVEEVGFKGIWASGLSISAALGVRDNNEASWTQVLEVLEFMSDATTIPILLDGDTGYGNFNNARRLVKKLEQRQVAGVCIEDKLFPKTNSFIKGEAQPLAEIDEFCGKIKAMKDSQQDDDFVVVSRVEAFIAGWGLKEALKRAEAYRKAGADAVLIHSKRSDHKEIEAFMKEWGDRLPVVIVPTKYYSVPTDSFRDMGISLTIWANHNLRASIKAMQQTSGQIFQDTSLINVEKSVAPLEDVFRLQQAEELAAAEEIYLQSTGESENSIIIARSPADRQPLVNEQMNQFKEVGVKEVTTLEVEKEGELGSLYKAKDIIGENTTFSYNDILYKTHILTELTDNQNDITIVVDADYEIDGKSKAFVKGNKPYSKLLYSKTVELDQMSAGLDTQDIHGEFIGLWKVSGQGGVIVKGALEDLAQKEDFNQRTLVDLFNHIQSFHPVAIHYIKGSWLDYETYKKIEEEGEDG
jgi:phosphoenolpyruvate phosphomutase